MKKFAMIAIAAAVIAVLCGVLIGCQDYTWGPVGTTNPDAPVTGNGTVAVMQGDTVYFINGKADPSTITEGKDNWFGRAGVKGNVMKGTLAADGSVTGVEIVVPKMVYTANAEGGLYVFGEWIYYTSPSTDTTSDGVVQTSYQEFYRTKTDGTETQLITSVKANTFDYIYTPGALFYYDSNEKNVIMVAYTDAEIGDTTTVAENVTSVKFVKDSDYTRGQARVSDMFFYTKAADENDPSVLYGNNVYVCDYSGKSVHFIGKDTFKGGEGSVASQYQYAVTLLDYTVEDGGVALYYSRTGYSGGNADANKTYTAEYLVTADAVKNAGEGPFFDVTAEKILANSNLSSITAISYNEGVIKVDSENYLYVYKNVNGNPVKEAVGDDDGDGKGTALEGAPTVISFRQEAAGVNNYGAGLYMYYTVSNKLLKLNLTTGAACAAVLDSTQDTVYTDYVSASMITRTVDGKEQVVMFYQNGIISNYTSVVVLSNLNYYGEYSEDYCLESKIACGYYESGKYEGDKNYAVDEDGNYTVTDPDNSEATITITKPLPRFMSSEDLKTYITTYKKA